MKVWLPDKTVIRGQLFFISTACWSVLVAEWRFILYPCSLGVCCSEFSRILHVVTLCQPTGLVAFLNQTILHSSTGTYVAPWTMDPSLHSSCPHEHSVDGGQRGHQVLDLWGCRQTLLRKQRFLRGELRGKSKHAGGRSRWGEGVIWGKDSMFQFLTKDMKMNPSFFVSSWIVFALMTNFFCASELFFQCLMAI